MPENLLPLSAPPQIVNSEEFLTGVVAALASRGLQSIKFNTLETAILNAFPKWQKQFEAHGLQLGFVLSKGTRFKENKDLRDGLKAVERKGLVMAGRASILFQIKSSGAAYYLNSLKGTAELWDDFGALLIQEEG